MQKSPAKIPIQANITPEDLDCLRLWQGLKNIATEAEAARQLVLNALATEEDNGASLLDDEPQTNRPSG